MRRIDIFVSSPADVQKERSLAERLIRSIAAEFNVPVTVSYSNWLRRLSPSDKVTALSANGLEEDRSLLCPCFWEYQDFKSEQDYRERIPNTGQYDLVICILWSRLGTRISPAFVMPDGSQPTSATEYEIAWVLDQANRTPGFPELHVYRNRSTPVAPLEPKEEREISFEQWDSVQEFFAAWEKRSAFSEACSAYHDLQEFEELFREHFRAFLAKQLEREITPRKGPQRAQYWKSNPYRGLQSYDFEHAPIFHGRTRAIGEVLDTLKKQAISKKPFVLVLGMRGSGKSSLVRAGVLPLLAEVGEANGPWRRAVTRPGPGGAAGDPIDRLAAALLADSALPELETAVTHNGRGNLASELREHPDSAAVRLTEVLDQISLQQLDRLLDDEEGESPLPGRIEGVELARHRMLRRVKPKAHLALVVDQLEDLFATGYTAELQHRYITALVALIRCQRIFVIATLQSDFYAYFQQFSELAEFARVGGRFDLQPPTQEELGNMIRLPAGAAGLRFERDSASGRSLDEALLDAAATNSEPLPLLGHLLSQLYRIQLARKDRLLRLSDYKEMGELEGALDKRAETVFTELGSDEQEAFDFVMRRLVSSGSGEGDVHRGVPYRDLVSSPEFDHRQKAGAKGLVDRFIKEELFSAETDTKQEIIVSIAHEVLLKRWRRARLWLAEDQGFLRMRDRLDANLKLWLSRDRRCNDLLGPEFGIADAETLLRHFRSALNKTQIDYIQKILAKKKHGRIRNISVLAVGAGLVVLATFAGVQWYNTNIHRKRAAELARFERRQEELANDQRIAQASSSPQNDKPPLSEQNADLSVNEGSALQTQLALEAELKKAEEKAQAAQQNADLAAAQRSGMEAELKKAQDKAQAAQQNADIATAQRSAMEAELKKAKDNAQTTQQNADLGTSQRSALEAELKKTKDNAQAAQQNADLATSQRSALEAELKKAKDNAQAAQQNADLGTSERSTLEAELKKAQDDAQAAQQNADLATSQRSALEAELKKAKDNAQAAQQNADLATSQRSALEAELKKAKDEAQAAQQNADLVTSQRSTLEADLEKAEEKAQAAQQIADLAATQHGALDVELRKASEKAQQAQQIADLASGQRSAMETELKMAEQRAELAQQTADLATTQRKAMETELKKAAESVQQAQQIADLAITQRNEMESELKKARQQLNEAEETGQTAQKSSDFGTNQPKSEPTPSTAISTASTPADPHAGENASGDEQALKKFVLDYLQTVASDDVSTQENFFSRRVTYYNQGVISLRKVQEAKESYDREWPKRDWKPKGEPEIRPSANPKLYEVFQPFTWTASDGSRTDQGSATLYFRIFKNSNGQFHIVHIERHDQ
jgi:ketosteroid isomerase-like protein